MRMTSRVSTTLLLAFLAGACTAAEEEAEPTDQPITVADVGFQTPESVLHDAAADVYLVSNINGSPLEKDDNGFISRLNPDGTVETLKWIDGTAADVTLSAPKGMAIAGDTLLVADIDAVRLFDRTTGAPLGSWEVEGATFLNDMAVAHDGVIYVTDSGLRASAEGFEQSGTDAVYRFEDGEAVALVRGAALGNPNGIVADGDRLLIVTFGSGEVTVVDRDQGTISGMPSPERGQLDGIVAESPGIYLISSWAGQAIYRLGPGGNYSTVLDSLEAPADIGWDATRGRVLVPLFSANAVAIRPIG